MSIPIKILGTTAMAALLTLSSPAAFAQTAPGSGESETDTSDGVKPVQEALDAARIQDDTSTNGQSSDTGTASEGGSSDGSLEEMMDANNVPATDGNYEMEGGASPQPAGNTPGDIQPPEGEIDFGGSSAEGQQAEQSGQSNQTSSNQAEQNQQNRTMMLDLDGFAQQIYERGYRQGYLNGISDGREQAMRQMHGANQRQERDRLRGEERPQQRGDRNSQQSGGASEGSGGSIIVLPPGVSPEAFVEQLMRRSQ